MPKTGTRQIIIPEDFNDIDAWPDVDTTTLNEYDKNEFKKNKQAIRSYFIGEKLLREISIDSGISAPEIVRRAKRCLKTHKDGRIWGYRALIPKIRITSYKRTKEPSLDQSGFGGDSGAFSYLLDTYPSLREFIYQRVIKKLINGKIKAGRVQIKSLFNDFIKEVKKLGIKGYPLNRKEKGRFAFHNYVKTLFENFPQANAEHLYGKDVANTLVKTGIGDSPKTASRCFKRVECDEHKIDLITTILVPLVGGGYKQITLDRFWIIVIEDVFNRAVIGYHIALKERVNKLDILRALARCTESQPRKAVVIPELNDVKGGLPIDLIPDLQWISFDEISFDRDTTHKSNSVKSVLKNVFGSRVIMGEAHLPITRPYIEKFFGLLESELHQLPNTTGSHVNDPCRNMPATEAIRHGITAERINELLDACIAEYNVNSDRPALGYRSPIEITMQDIEAQYDKGLPYRKIPINKQDHINIVGQRHKCRVVNGKGRRRPYINFKHVRYNSDTLSMSPELCGSFLTILADPDDLRFLKAYLDTGEELGILQARGDWGIIPHTLETRSDYFKDHHKETRYSNSEEKALSIYLMDLASKSQKSKISASRWAHGMQTIYSNVTQNEFDDLIQTNKQLSTHRKKYHKETRLPAKRHSTIIINR